MMDTKNSSPDLNLKSKNQAETIEAMKEVDGIISGKIITKKI